MMFVRNNLNSVRNLARSLISFSIVSTLLLCLTFTLTGCNEKPGTYSEADLARRIKRTLIKKGLEVTDVTVTAKPERDLAGWSRQSEGTGHLADGEEFKVLVTQYPDQGSMSFTAIGERGSLFDEPYIPRIHP